jgi:hypothetical protein
MIQLHCYYTHALWRSHAVQICVLHPKHADPAFTRKSYVLCPNTFAYYDTIYII